MIGNSPSGVVPPLSPYVNIIIIIVINTGLLRCTNVLSGTLTTPPKNIKLRLMDRGWPLLRPNNNMIMIILYYILFSNNIIYFIIIYIIWLWQYYYIVIFNFRDSVRGVGTNNMSPGRRRIIYCGDRRTRPDGVQACAHVAVFLFHATDKPVGSAGSVFTNL